MIIHSDVPYADPETFAELIQECRCLEDEFTTHGVGLHPAHRPEARHPASVAIREETRHMVDGYPAYGT